MKRIVIGVMVSLAGCSAVTGDEAPELLRVRNCAGPATSLDPGVVATLPPRTGHMVPDDGWADLAASVPGGFAGVYYDGGRPILLLTQTALEAEAKAALAGQVPGFDVQGASVRQARWDFAQLVDWFNYFSGIHKPGLTSADKDEVENRIRYGVIDEDSRAALAQTLETMQIPCDLVLIEIMPPARALAR